MGYIAALACLEINIEIGIWAKSLIIGFE